MMQTQINTACRLILWKLCKRKLQKNTVDGIVVQLILFEVNKNVAKTAIMIYRMLMIFSSKTRFTLELYL